MLRLFICAAVVLLSFLSAPADIHAVRASLPSPVYAASPERLPAPTSSEKTRTVLLLGVQQPLLPGMHTLVEHTVENLNRLNESTFVQVKYFDPDQISDSSSLRDLDFLIVSPKIYAVAERYFGFSAVSTLTAGGDRLHSAAVYVKADPDCEAVTFNELKGKTFGLLRKDTPETKLLLDYEGFVRTGDTKVFSAHKTTVESIEALRSGLLSEGLFSAVVLSTDFAETLPKSLLSDLTVVEPRSFDGLDKLHSLNLLPGWVFASGFKTHPDDKQNLGALLSSLSDQDGFRWEKPSDYSFLHQTLEETADSLYLSFQKRSWLQLIKDEAAWGILVLFILFSVVYHIAASQRLVRQTTRELYKTMEEKRRAEQNYEALERATAVAQMSNIVAHELRQPLAAVSNFAQGLIRRAKNGTLTEQSLDFALNRMIRENQRASDIVEHVRNYAKRRDKDIQRVELQDLLQKVCKAVSSEAACKTNVTIDLSVAGSVSLQADPLELELVFRNLLKNAVEALSGADTHKPRVAVSLEKKDGDAVITVADNGNITDETALEPLSKPMFSEKSAGLGLGLSIVRKIIESCDGTLKFTLNKPNGLKVIVSLPIEQTDSSTPKASAHQNKENYHGTN